MNGPTKEKKSLVGGVLRNIDVVQFILSIKIMVKS